MLMLMKNLKRGRIITFLAKYAFIAVFEVVMIVVGIGIALRFDAKVEDNKRRDFEIMMLTEVLEACRDDLTSFRSFDEHLERRRDCIRRFEQALAKGTPVSDVEAGYLYGLFARSNFSYNDGPYRAIESVGLDRISDPVIRSRMVRLYSVVLPEAAHDIEVMESEFEANRSYMASLFEFEIDAEDGRLVLENPVWSDSKFEGSPEFSRILGEAALSLFVRKLGLRSESREVRELVSLIDSFLESHRQVHAED